MSDPSGQRPFVPVLRESPIWPPHVIEDIQTKAQLGRYRMQGFSMHRKVPSFDDLTLVPCTLSRVPLEGYRERCETRTVLGTRHAANPVVLDRPITIAGMSYGALSGRAKTALGRAAKRAGISTTTGDGGMCREERDEVDVMVYQVLPSRYGFDPDHLKLAQAVEIVVGQGAKPGTGGVLLGSKVSEEIAEQRTLPVGVDQRSPVRHPDFIGPDDLQLKIEEIREATDWQVPVYVKMGASRVGDDVKLAVKAGADVLVIDGMEGATGASPDVLLDHTGIPTLSALCEAVRALDSMKVLGDVQIIIRRGGRSRLQLPSIDDHGDADVRASLRQERRARPGGRGYARTDAGGVADHGHSDRRDRFHTPAGRHRRGGGGASGHRRGRARRTLIDA